MFERVREVLRATMRGGRCDRSDPPVLRRAYGLRELCDARAADKAGQLVTCNRMRAIKFGMLLQGAGAEREKSDLADAMAHDMGVSLGRCGSGALFRASPPGRECVLYVGDITARRPRDVLDFMDANPDVTLVASVPPNKMRRVCFELLERFPGRSVVRPDPSMIVELEETSGVVVTKRRRSSTTTSNTSVTSIASAASAASIENEDLRPTF